MEGGKVQVDTRWLKHKLQTPEKDITSTAPFATWRIDDKSVQDRIQSTTGFPLGSLPPFKIGL